MRHAAVLRANLGAGIFQDQFRRCRLVLHRKARASRGAVDIPRVGDADTKSHRSVGALPRYCLRRPYASSGLDGERDGVLGQERRSEQEQGEGCDPAVHHGNTPARGTSLNDGITAPGEIAETNWPPLLVAPPGNALARLTVLSPFTLIVAEEVLALAGCQNASVRN